MIGSSAGVTKEAAVEATVAVVGPIPGQAEGDGHAGWELCKSAAV